MAPKYRWSNFVNELMAKFMTTNLKTMTPTINTCSLPPWLIAAEQIAFEFLVRHGEGSGPLEAGCGQVPSYQTIDAEQRLRVLGAGLAV